MTIRQAMLHTLISALLASGACIIYNTIYSAALNVNFALVVNNGSIISASVLACLLIGTGSYFVYKWKGEKMLGALNVLIAVISFASIAGIFAVQLPLTIETPELFPGLAIPMLFFPALAYFAIAPFFKYANDFPKK